MTYLLATRYADSSELNLSDQITIPGSLWESLSSSSSSSSDCPIFVEVIEESGVVGRIVPGISSVADSCQLPEWMWRRLGLDPDGEETYIGLTVTPLSLAATVTLRAREETILTDLGDAALETLSAALSGAYGPSWACLSVGSELPLAIGIFDVMAIRSAEEDMTMASILNTDVILDLMPALDHVDTPTPATPPKPEPTPEPTPEVQINQQPQAQINQQPQAQINQQPQAQINQQPSQLQINQQLLRPRANSVVGFVPFSGRGHRLGDP